MLLDPSAPLSIISLRIALVVAGVAAWRFTQRLIKYRPTGTGVIGDTLHTLSAPLLCYLTAAHPASRCLAHPHFARHRLSWPVRFRPKCFWP